MVRLRRKLYIMLSIDLLLVYNTKLFELESRYISVPPNVHDPWDDMG